MKIAVLYNVSAGKDDNQNTLTDLLENSFLKHKVKPVLINISKKDIGEEIEKVIKNGIDIIAASGGDGTISSVASCICNKGIPLAVIPTGTLNHFAKDLNIPLDIQAAVDNIFTGEITAIDIAEVNGKIFLNNSSIGAYTHAVRKRAEHQKYKKLSKWKAMFFAMLHVFVRFPIYAVRLKVNNESEVIRSPLVFIGNNEYKMNFPSLGARDSLKQGVLSLFVAKTRTRFGIFKIVAKIILNYFTPFKIFEMMLVNEVEIESRKKYIHVSLDGEVEKLKPPLKYALRKKALKIIVPTENQK